MLLPFATDKLCLFVSAIKDVARKRAKEPRGGKNLIRANTFACVDLAVKACIARIELLWNGIDDQHLAAVCLKGEIKLRGVAEIFYAPKAEAVGAIQHALLREKSGQCRRSAANSLQS